MTKKTINWNGQVSVKPNEYGWEIYEKYYQNLRMEPPEHGDILRSELWNIANIFGPKLENGFKIPFESSEMSYEHPFGSGAETQEPDAKPSEDPNPENPDKANAELSEFMKAVDEDRLSDRKLYDDKAAEPVRIIQILATDEKSRWEGRLLGLGSDGITYECNSRGFWVPFILNVGQEDE